MRLSVYGKVVLLNLSFYSIFIIILCDIFSLSSLTPGLCLIFLLEPAKISFTDEVRLPRVFTPSLPPKKLITWSGRYACKANIAATDVVHIRA